MATAHLLNPASIIQRCQSLIAASNSIILAPPPPPPPPPQRNLGELPTDILTLILSYCGSFDEGSNAKSRLLFSLRCGAVNKNFNEASRSPLLFDHIDFLSYKRPVDQMLAAGRNKAMPSLIRIRTNPECFNIVYHTLKKCDLSKLAFFELFSVRSGMGGLMAPLIDTATRDGYQRTLTSASKKLYSATQELGGEYDSMPACGLLTDVCHIALPSLPLPDLHIRLDTYASLPLLAPLNNLTKLSLITKEVLPLDLTSLRSLVTLEIIGAVTQSNYLIPMPSLVSNSLRRLDITRAGKGFYIESVDCCELRTIDVDSTDGVGISPEEGEFERGEPYRVEEGLWTRYNSGGVKLLWTTHESCVVHVDSSEVE
jgi:hypothetical protein